MAEDMKLKIIRGSYDNVPECVEMLAHSELGKRYFSAEGSAEKAINEAANADTFYVAVRNHACVGFMYYIKGGAFHAFPYLHLLVVKESERGKGIGSKMLDELKSMLDHKQFYLVVADFNLNGNKFYEKNGFKQVGEIPGLYRTGITEYVMRYEGD